MKIAYVVPRYGLEVIGGAEYGARMLAERLVGMLGWSVDVLTTCALDARTWANEYPAGSVEIEGVSVHRFATSTTRHPRFDELSGPVLANPVATPAAEASAWIDRQGPVSPGLLDAVATSDADLVVFYPYLYDPTVRGVPLARGRAVMHPAAHDEPPLRLPVFREVFAGVEGLVYQTVGERELVERLFAVAHTRHLLMGLGVETGSGEPEAFRAAAGLGERPYLLYVGRVDDGKGTGALARFFAAYKERRPGPLALALVGPVVHDPPAHPDVLVVGPVDDEVKWGALRGASAFVHPSAYEAFSIVVIEALSVGTPVVVNARCPATLEHATRSGAGLWYDGYGGFEAVLDRLTADPGLARDLGAAGAGYVDGNYRWPVLIERYRGFLEAVRGRGGPASLV